MINKDFKEFIALLNSHKVKYLVIGGYALAFHGHPRYTKDIDIWILIDKNNAHNLAEAIKDFGFSSLQLNENDFLAANTVIQLGQAPSRIDILTNATGLEFSSCYPHKVDAEIDGVTISFIDLENLKKNKRAVGRHQDLADLEHLQ
jgi:hypothetical protein